uniref:G-protein coupled receptors family 1 profile domain-containing protein n=1 Tax=Sus scrofa TaxID=9823 RepID=A0A8D1EGL1_PIG
VMKLAGATCTLLGFSEYPDLQVPLFLVFLAIYTVTVTGNLGRITIIRVSPNLQTPMYYFLSHLSLVDCCYSPTVTPKLLKNFVVEVRTISFIRCIMQFFILCSFAVAETFMLAVMAYDQFVAVLKPLIHTVVMSPKLCASLVARPYPWGIVAPLMFTFFLLALSFCGSNIINNFVCEHSVIVSVSCTDPSISQVLCFVIAVFNEEISLKAFSTCASHLTTITLFHGMVLFLYCAVLIPMLNPLIYSLRNKDVKESARSERECQEVNELLNTMLLKFCISKRNVIIT